MNFVSFLVIVELTLTFALNNNTTENSNETVNYSTVILSTTYNMNNATNENSEETSVPATVSSFTTDIMNLSVTEEPANKVMQFQFFDYKALEQSSGRNLEGIIAVVEDIALTKCAENCMNRANCETINFNFYQMTCELIKQSGGTIQEEDGWTHFKTLNWTKTNSPQCEGRPCSGRDVCVGQRNGDHMCLLTHCDKPPSLPGTTQTSDNYKLGQTITYLCEEGVKYTGNPHITCTDDGTWTPTAFKCQCPDPPSISGITLPSDRVIGTTIQYKCHYNMRTLSSSTPRIDTITCGSNGVWSSTPNVHCECQNPPTKAHAYISQDTGRRINNYVRYDCTGSRWDGSTGRYIPYAPHGNHYLYCQSNGWHPYSSFYCQ